MIHRKFDLYNSEEWKDLQIGGACSNWKIFLRSIPLEKNKGIISIFEDMEVIFTNKLYFNAFYSNSMITMCYSTRKVEGNFKKARVCMLNNSDFVVVLNIGMTGLIDYFCNDSYQSKLKTILGFMMNSIISYRSVWETKLRNCITKLYKGNYSEFLKKYGLSELYKDCFDELLDAMKNHGWLVYNMFKLPIVFKNQIYLEYSNDSDVFVRFIYCNKCLMELNSNGNVELHTCSLQLVTAVCEALSTGLATGDIVGKITVKGNDYKCLSEFLREYKCKKKKMSEVIESLKLSGYSDSEILSAISMGIGSERYM